MIKYLTEWINEVNLQKGRPYPYSNQIVKCAVITRDKKKALIEMRRRGAQIYKKSRNYIEWQLNNEQWIWLNWHIDAHRGYRFYKILVDKNIDKELFMFTRIKSATYCCHAELI